jgi:hypothetical protein
VLVSGKSVPTQRRVSETTPSNDTPGAAPQLEMVLIQRPQGGMKISFRKCVPQKNE